MIRDVKSYMASNAAAAKAIETLTTMVQNYAEHKFDACDDGATACKCGLQVFKLIGEGQLAEFRDTLEKIRFAEFGER